MRSGRSEAEEGREATALFRYAKADRRSARGKQSPPARPSPLAVPSPPLPLSSLASAWNVSAPYRSASAKFAAPGRSQTAMELSEALGVVRRTLRDDRARFLGVSAERYVQLRRPAMREAPSLRGPRRCGAPTPPERPALLQKLRSQPTEHPPV